MEMMEKGFLVLLMLALSSPWLGVAVSSEGKVLCGMKSLTWQGTCDDSIKCNSQCKDWEVAVKGACYVVRLKSSCVCYFKLNLSSCLGTRYVDRLFQDPELESALRASGAPFLL